MGRSSKDRKKPVGQASLREPPSSRPGRRKGASSAAKRRTGDAHAPIPRHTEEATRGGWAAWIKSRWPVVRFLVVLSALIGAFYAVYSPFTGTALFSSYLSLLAEACAPILRLLGHDVTVSGTSIHGPRFSTEIVMGCDGIEMIALFVAAVLASPVGLRSRLLCIVVGTVILMMINLVRIVSLFCIGVYFPNALDVIHLDVWPGVLIVLVLLSWLLWARWAARKKDLHFDVAV